MYLCAADPVLFGSGILAARRDGSRDPRCQVTEVRSGRAALRVPPGAWTFGRVHTLSTGPNSSMVRYLLLAPRAAGETQREHVALERGKPRLHTFVLAETLRAIDRGSVTLHRREVPQGGPARRVATTQLDAAGHAAFPLGEPAMYMVTPAGVAPESQGTARAVVMRRPGAPDHDVLVRVARPRARGNLTLVLTSGAPPAVAEPVVLYLENLGGGPRYFPLRYRAQRGRVEVNASLPAGRYALRALPDGVLAGEDGRGDPAISVDVFPHDTPPLRTTLWWNTARCAVALEGAAPTAFPVMVRRRVSDRCGLDRGGGKYLGTYRWSAERGTVCSVRGRCFLDVIGRSQSYLSAARVDLSGAAARVDLRPATRVTVFVESGALDRAVGECVLLVDSELGRESAALHGELMPGAAGSPVVWSALLLLPRGPARLVLWDPRAKVALAESSLDCSLAEQTVRL
ncbi:MAG: hypothetical protein H6837_00740 [Planctomycetes bacterium]|nr:hypothetical protein [Planctomycetota bacterium]